MIGPQFDANGVPLFDPFTNEAVVYEPEFNILAGRLDGVRVLKYEPDIEAVDGNNNASNDRMIFRFSDVVLMKAEAQFQLGASMEVLILVNQLRANRNVAALTVLTEQDLLNERGFELYWEGWRRQDLIRFGQFTRAWANKPISDKSREVFSIPQVALDINPNLTQNPGY